MWEFEISYFYGGGAAKLRTGVVFAEDLEEAVAKIRKVDDEYNDVCDVRFKEIPGWVKK